MSVFIKPNMTASIRKLSAVVSAFIIALLATAVSGHTQTAEKLNQVNKIYVDSLGVDPEAKSTRNSLIRRLERSPLIKMVSHPSEADAVVKGTARIWSTGHISLNPRTHGPVEPVLEGFLSAEIIGRNEQTLWSYLVTPSKFPWGGIPDDLAKQFVSRLLGALKESSQREPAVTNATAINGATLAGAGASFPAPLYQRWFQLFGEAHPGIHLSYKAVGSAEGIRQLTHGEVDFGASEMPLSDETAPELHSKLTQIPVVLGAVVPIYNVKGLRQNLNFTPEILAGIYLGKLTKWSDGQIKKANPGLTLPNDDIVVIHRSDGSGTTFVWSGYLSKINAEWKAKSGAGLSVQWPVGVGAELNEGVASAVQRTPNSIGYVEFIYAIQHELSFAAVRNAAGQFIKADVSSVTMAARASEGSVGDLRVSLTDSPEKDAYPIATYTWLMFADVINDKDKKTALHDLVRWMLTSGQKSCSALGYAPLPPEVAKRALQSVDQVQ